MEKEREDELKRIWEKATKNAKFIKNSYRWVDPKDEKARIDTFFDLMEQRMKRPENQEYYYGEE